MNIKKIIKYILIAIPALFLAKCGVEFVIHNVDLTSDIKPNPTHKMMVHGNFPFEDEVKLDMGILFITTNPICDNKNWLAGIRFPHSFMKSFPATVKDGAFESDIYLDSYQPGFCKWQAYGVYILLQGTKDDVLGPDTPVGVIAYEIFKEQGQTLDVECFRRKQFSLKSISKEKTYTEYYCRYLGEISRPIPDSGSKHKANISSSQKEVEINFIDKGWRK